jgi:hypothetical protein
MPMNPRLLRPIASGVHPEANAWRTAVVANGGSVSASTMKAVSKFCGDIDKAGLRDRFYRLNLFCGSNLNAVLVPLYRGPSRTGSQFGNTTDTNNGPFVSGDYSESSGLKGNGSSKYLETGVAMTFLGTNQLHMFVSFNPEVAEFRMLLAARANLAGSVAVENNYNGTTANRPRTALFSGGFQPDHLSPITGRTQYWINNSSNPIEIYGRNVNLNNFNNAGAYSATNNEAFLVFAGNQTGTGIAGHGGQRIDAYSFGAAFTTTAQRNDFHTAMSDFRTTLGRT